MGERLSRFSEPRYRVRMFSFSRLPVRAAPAVAALDRIGKSSLCDLRQRQETAGRAQGGIAVERLNQRVLCFFPPGQANQGATERDVAVGPLRIRSDQIDGGQAGRPGRLS